ncbi:putative membrane protein YqgA involved in biofilm formation [Pontibacter aydingkolensis]|uniref:Uncharacterized protein n=1 Tax=Pontibacter aydingkolensis TaxID=1911536 RepID=A0ABS7CRC8_9BACT|nr:hypothetical protein [Pontibacter aydingkolensis]MBW7466077.1 hypothetical protein [Pontibacter aydingkolensis]
MNPILRNILAVIAGFAIGSIVNMGIISVSGSIIPPPAGADVTTMEGLQASMHLFEIKHFIFPFLAHALGTLVGAFLAAKIAATHKMKFALAVGVFFLAGGIASVFMLPSPIWYAIVDLVGAYIPMAYLAGKLAAGNKTMYPSQV